MEVSYSPSSSEMRVLALIPYSQFKRYQKLDRGGDGGSQGKGPGSESKYGGGHEEDGKLKTPHLELPSSSHQGKDNPTQEQAIRQRNSELRTPSLKLEEFDPLAKVKRHRRHRAREFLQQLAKSELIQWDPYTGKLTKIGNIPESEVDGNIADLLPLALSGTRRGRKRGELAFFTAVLERPELRRFVRSVLNTDNTWYKVL